MDFTDTDRAMLVECNSILHEFKSLLEALAPMAGAMGLPVPGLASGSSPAVQPWN